ncbi:DUF535 family protein [Bradyrhizobium sp. AS23.2]|uniref:DUF535 family protein n=1 Tax=Bradyrhizobium sp. AS23.2 TaxID=1680155 RepID=UPI00093F8B5F|nr:DUF535 family protein [Bradyrhizobium sp. AS23.2]OKO75147.1 hypothetical protein AC630_25510 [Bradyrhizobium sp. AS23.2]
MFFYYLSRIANTKIANSLALAFAILRHANLLFPLVFASRKSDLARYLRARPEIVEIVYGRFIADNWDAATKLRTALSHVETVAAIGGAVDTETDLVTDLIELPLGEGYRISLDQPRWLLREGQLALSLWESKDRIFSVSFSLRTDADGRTAFVGGIQGRRQVDGEEDVLERYRRFTKCAHGVRPRDFILEVFKIFCKVIGICRILAVAQDNHPLSGKSGGFSLAYDEIWQERGGQYDGRGFYSLPVGLSMKAEDGIPAKKRSQYRKRSTMFADIEQDLSEHLATRQLESRPAEVEVHAKGDISSLDTLLRILAYTGAVFVLASTNVIGGTWIGFAIGLAFVHGTYWILKGNIPERAGERIRALTRLRQSSMVVRVMLAIAILAIGVAVDLQLDQDRALGRIFKLYFILVFVSSLCLGTRVTLVVCAACLVALNFLHLPPRYSFAISSWQEALDMLVFGAMAAVVVVIPRLLLVSVELAALRRGQGRS